jgi:anti-sigma-K factor RskA
VMTAPDAHAATAHADATGTTTIVASRSLNKIVMTAAQLRAVPATKTYQLWFMTPGSARSAGIMPASPHRPPPPIIAGNLQDAQQIGLTIEPAGGSPHPTSPPLLVIPLT